MQISLLDYVVQVSIPFKRESVSKERNLLLPVHYRSKVSIPFKRESVSKVGLFLMLGFIIDSFNSLQTGKCIQSNRFPLVFIRDISCFNSLQTGKCIQRRRCWHITLILTLQVSIPFKRESVSKVVVSASDRRRGGT